VIVRTLLGLLLGALTASGAAAAESDAAGRLDRFRQLATLGLGALELSGAEAPSGVVHDLYTLIDDEILDNLKSGGVFASEAFIQERLDLLSEAWGAARFRVLPLKGGHLLAGAFQLSSGASGNSVRIYSGRGPQARLLGALPGVGAPTLLAVPPTRTGEAQVLVAWAGSASGRGTRTLRLELWRERDGSVNLAWSGEPEGGADGLVRQFALGNTEASFRYEAGYPGWKPGCEGQTEFEDLYRYAPESETFVLVRRRVHDDWHRELHQAFAALLAAINGGDPRALAALVPDGRLRVRLPARLEAEAACDQADGPSPTTASVTAVAPAETGAEGRAAAPGQPWTLTFRRTPEGWRLAGATPLEVAAGGGGPRARISE
jgi:hypothetical protein